MEVVIDFDTCGYGDSLGGLELMGKTPQKVIFKIPQGRLKRSYFKEFFTYRCKEPRGPQSNLIKLLQKAWKFKTVAGITLRLLEQIDPGQILNVKT